MTPNSNDNRMDKRVHRRSDFSVRPLDGNCNGRVRSNINMHQRLNHGDSLERSNNPPIAGDGNHGDIDSGPTPSIFINRRISSNNINMHQRLNHGDSLARSNNPPNAGDGNHGDIDSIPTAPLTPIRTAGVDTLASQGDRTIVKQGRPVHHVTYIVTMMKKADRQLDCNDLSESQLLFADEKCRTVPQFD
eukprot:jgi/Psemu1/15876/gm1.15876_g